VHALRAKHHTLNVGNNAKKDMIPNIFISSTIADLNYLRDSIRDLFSELGYNPIMSEYGGVGYLPSDSAENSCYLAMRDCQLAVVIVGKRYGSISENGLSITHNEFKTAREQNIPVIFLINEETLSFKKVFDSNKDKTNLELPGMDNPNKVFSLIKEFMDSEINNGIVTYSTMQSAKNNLKQQLAHLFGDLLRKQFDSEQNNLKDILSQITTLKHVLLEKEGDFANSFSYTFRSLLDDVNNYMKDICEEVYENSEKGATAILEFKNFDEFLKNKNVDIIIKSTDELKDELRFDNFDPFEKGIMKICHSMLPYQSSRNRASLDSEPEFNIKPDPENDKRIIFGFGKNKFIGNRNSKNLLDEMFLKIQKH
jgi:hypothetical protein